MALGCLKYDFIDLPKPLVNSGMLTSTKFICEIYAPKGIGALYIKDADWYDDLLGYGCANLPYLKGFEKALELSTVNLSASRAHRKALKEKLINGLEALDLGLKVLGEPRLDCSHPGIVNVYFPMMDGDK